MFISLLVGMRTGIRIQMGKSRSHFSNIMEAVLGLSYIQCRMGSAKSEETGRERVKLA